MVPFVHVGKYICKKYNFCKSIIKASRVGFTPTIIFKNDISVFVNFLLKIPTPLHLKNSKKTS